MINRNNYETYLIDYLDGNLDAVQVSELLLFLEQYPEIKEEFEGIKQIQLETSTTIIPQKELLKQPVFHEVAATYYPLLVDKTEGTISHTDLNQLLNAQKRYPELVHEEMLFSKTILFPENQIIYPNKKALKKSVPLYTYLPLLARVAAILLLLGTGWWYMQTTQVETVTADAETMKQKNDALLPTETNKGNEWKQVAKTDVARKRKEKVTIHPSVNDAVSLALVKTKSGVIEPIKARWEQEIILTGISNRIAYTQTRVEQTPYKEIPELIVSGIQAQKEEILTENNKPANKAIKPGDAGWAALNLLNKLTGADIKVVRTYDANGNKTGIEIAARDFEYSAK